MQQVWLRVLLSYYLPITCGFLTASSPRKEDTILLEASGNLKSRLKLLSASQAAAGRYHRLKCSESRRINTELTPARAALESFRLAHEQNQPTSSAAVKARDASRDTQAQRGVRAPQQKFKKKERKKKGMGGDNDDNSNNNNNNLGQKAEKFVLDMLQRRLLEFLQRDGSS